MKKLPWRIERKKEILKFYQAQLEDVKQVKFFKQDLDYTTPWFIDVLVDNRDDLQIWLKENGIGTRVMYPPINKQAAYLNPGDFPVSNLVGKNGLWLPSASQLSDSDLFRICSSIKSFYCS